MSLETLELEWKKKYKSLPEYYKGEYDSGFFNFGKWELEIDPSETMDFIEAYSSDRRNKELWKCGMSFSYFCQKYVKIAHPVRGLLPFVMFDYQKRCIKEYETNRFNILSKFRQGGLTTVTVLWCMWRCLFKLDETIMIISKSDREAIAAGEIVKRALSELPTWLKPEMSKNNDHQAIFADTGCKMFFYTPEAARGRSMTYLVLDEAAFIKQMDKHWKAIYPTIATGGKCICISTVNGVGNWYYDVYHGAKNKRGLGSEFNLIELDYWEHPEYHEENWVKQMKAQLGDKGWRQEVMRDFLGAGESFIPVEVITDLGEITKGIEPLKMMFPQWNNQYEAQEQGVADLDLWKRGALHIWREPIDGREYIIGVDSAEGMDNENDNSAFEVIDALTCEQVAEFYSNVVPPHDYAQIVSMVGKMYNNALVAVETASTGLAVIEKLQRDFAYENLFYTTQGSSKNPKPGFKTTTANRPRFIELLQTRLINRSMAVRSRRFVKELKGFIWDAQTKKAKATRGFHDDAIMAYCFALYAREETMANMPQATVEGKEFTEAYKAEIFEGIKKEFESNLSLDFLQDEDEFFAHRKRQSLAEIYGFNRNQDSLIKEFGW